jgi:hypothetical protein
MVGIQCGVDKLNSRTYACAYGRRIINHVHYYIVTKRVSATHIEVILWIKKDR